MAKPVKPNTELEEPEADRQETAEPVALENPGRPEQEDAQGSEDTGADQGRESGIPDPVVLSGSSAQPAPKRSGPAIMGFVTGGILAAVIGFGAARFVIPEGWPTGGGSQVTAALEQKITEQGAAIAALNQQLSALTDAQAAAAKGRAGELDALRNDLTALIAASGDSVEASVAALADQLPALGARLTDLEKRPVEGGGMSEAAAAAYDRELQAVKADLEAQRQASAGIAGEFEAVVAETRAKLEEAQAQALALRAEAEAGARTAAASAAMSRVQAAFETGGSFASALADLNAVGIAVPDALIAAAEAGVPSLADLQRHFPEAARAGLEASIRASTGASWTERVTAYLKIQTGARSLEMREGSDPDAVLSRAEAAMREGRVDNVLAEIAALPAEGQAAMADFVGLATRRMQAAQAVEALVSALNDN